MASVSNFTILSLLSYKLIPIKNAFSKIELPAKSEMRMEHGGNLPDITLTFLQSLNPIEEEYFRYMNNNLTNWAAGLLMFVEVNLCSVITCYTCFQLIFCSLLVKKLTYQSPNIYIYIVLTLYKVIIETVNIIHR